LTIRKSNNYSPLKLKLPSRRNIFAVITEKNNTVIVDFIINDKHPQTFNSLLPLEVQEMNKEGDYIWKSAIMKPGDFFLLQKSRYDWTHTGIIISVSNDVIETIEGNTNQVGSRNGIAVLKRTRNFRNSKLDVFSIEPLV